MAVELIIINQSITVYYLSASILSLGQSWPIGWSVGLVTRGCGFKSRVRQELSVGVVNNERSLHLLYHDWGETLEQGTEPPTAPRPPQHWQPTAPGVCSRCVCVHYCVCMHLDGINAEHKFQVWVATLHIYILYNYIYILWLFHGFLESYLKYHIISMAYEYKCYSKY